MLFEYGNICRSKEHLEEALGKSSADVLVAEGKAHDANLAATQLSDQVYKLRQELLDLSRKLTAFERECAEVRAAKAELRDLLREILPSGGAL